MDQLKIEEVAKRGIKGLRVRFDLPSTAAAVIDLMWDVDRFAKLFPSILELRLVAAAEGSQDVRYRVDAVYKEVTYTLRRTRQDRVDGTDIEWYMLSGDLRSIFGAWRITENAGSGCSVVYESYVNASVLVPTSVVRKIARTKVREMVDRVRQASGAASASN